MRVENTASLTTTDISALTGSTASTAQLDAENAETSTAAPSGRRDRIRQQLMSKL